MKSNDCIKFTFPVNERLQNQFQRSDWNPYIYGVRRYSKRIPKLIGLPPSHLYHASSMNTDG